MTKIQRIVYKIFKGILSLIFFPLFLIVAAIYINLDDLFQLFGEVFDIEN